MKPKQPMLKFKIRMLVLLAPISASFLHAEEPRRSAPVEIIAQYMKDAQEGKTRVQLPDVFAREGYSYDQLLEGMREFLRTTTLQPFQVMTALGSLGDRGWKLDLEMLPSESPSIRGAVAFELGSTSSEAVKSSDVRQRAVIKALIPLLDDSDSFVQSCASFALYMIVRGLIPASGESLKPGMIGLLPDMRKALKGHWIQLQSNLGDSLSVPQVATDVTTPTATLSDSTLIQPILALADNDIPGDAAKLIERIVYGWEEPARNRAALEAGVRAGDVQMARLSAALLAHLWPQSLDERIMKFLIQDLGDPSLHEIPSIAFRALRDVQSGDAEPIRLRLLEEATHSKNAQTRRLSALALAWNRQYPSDDRLLDLVAENLQSDKVPSNGLTSLDVLSRQDNSNATKRLLTALESDDEQARGLAALGVLEGGFAEPNSDLIGKLEFCLKADYRKDPAIVKRTLTLLRKTDRKLLNPSLERLIQVNSNEPLMNARIVDLLSLDPHYVPSTETIPTFVESLHDDGFFGNAGDAIEALERPRDPSSDGPIIAALHSRNRQQRLYAALILRKSRSYEAMPHELASVVLDNLHDDESSLYRGVDEEIPEGVYIPVDSYPWFNAKDTSLYLIAHPSLATPELEAGLDDRDPQYRWLCAFVLGSTGRSGRLDRLAEILIPRLERRDGMALYAIARLGKRAGPFLEPYRGHHDIRMRAAIAVLLARMRNPKISIYHVPEVAEIDQKYEQYHRAYWQAWESKAPDEERWKIMDEGGKYGLILDFLKCVDEMPDWWHYN